MNQMFKTYILASLVIVNICSTSNAITDSALGATTFTSGAIGTWLGAAIAKKISRLDDPSAKLSAFTFGVAAATITYQILHRFTPESRLAEATKINESVTNEKIINSGIANSEQYNQWVKTCFKDHPQVKAKRY